MEKTAIVTGCSSGIGFETALALARKKFYTFATMRDSKKGEKISRIASDENLKLKVIDLDVDSENSVKDGIRRILKESDRIDVLVNNAGYGLFGCLEDLSMDDLKEQFETNLFGIVRVSQAVIPQMRFQKSGTIVNISSVAGRIGFPGSSAYISSKFALEGLSESMRFELFPFGINVVIIEPGVIKTNFMNSIKKSVKPESVYKELTDKVINGISMMSEMSTPPEEVARTIIKAINSENPLPRYVVGNDAVMFLEAKKAKTDIDFENYLKKELY